MAIPLVQYPTIFGDFDSRDLLDRPVPEVDQTELFDQMERALAIYSELTADIVGILAETTQIAKERFDAGMLGGADSGMLQPRGEFGRVLATQPFTEQGAENAFEVGYPIAAWGDRAIFTPEFLLRSTVRQVQNKTFDAMLRDANTLQRHVLNAIFQPANYSYVDNKVYGQNLGAYEVKRLLNADSIPGVVKLPDGSLIELGQLNAYKVSGGTSFANGTFIMAHDYLTDLGMATDIVYYIAPSDSAAVKLLSDFVPDDPTGNPPTDPNIIDPPIVDGTVVAPSRALVKSPRSIGRMRAADGNSGEVVVLPWMPAGYLLALDRAAEKPVVIRESDVAQLRGFRLVDENGMVPVIGGDRVIANKYWQRVFGCGVRNRANGCIVQITNNSTYSAPNFFVTT